MAQLVHTIQNMVRRAWASEGYFFMPCHIDLPCCCASDSENRTRELSELLWLRVKELLKNAIKRIKKGFAHNSKAPSWTEKTRKALSGKGEASYILPENKIYSRLGVVKYVHYHAFTNHFKRYI